MRKRGSYDPIVFKTERGERGTMKLLTLEYIAGFVDGEGCFTIGLDNKNVYYPVFEISNTNLQILQDIQKFFGLRPKVQVTRYKDITRKTVYQIKKGSIDDCKSIAMLLEPYLRIKKEQAQIIMQFPRADPTKRGRGKTGDLSTKVLQQKLRNKIMKLNKKGPPDQESDEDLQVEPDPQGSLFDLNQKEITNP